MNGNNDTSNQPANQTNDQQTKPNSFLITLLSVLLLMSVFIAGFFAYQTQKLVKELTVVNQERNVIPVESVKPSSDPYSGWKKLASDQFSFTLSYPETWVHETNAKTTFNLPYVKGFSSNNETLTNNKGCAIHFGFGGTSGPSDELSKEDTTLDSQEYTRNLWSINKQPVFASYSYDGKNPELQKFELLYTWIDGKDSLSCQKEIDQIFSTLKFTKSVISNSPSPIACTMEAKICPDGSSVGRIGPKCEFSPCPTPKS